MARPLRVEFPGACYHIMNRGRGRQRVFHDAVYHRAFLQSVAEAAERFAVRVYAYCLTPHDYHLLLSTPEANLGRAMRHINGTYTQRYNRIRESDGSLFRGRYKSILIDRDAYLLRVSRYVHRKPLVNELTQVLGDYPWSSYPAYIGATSAPQWLQQDALLGHYPNAARAADYYRDFVAQPTDDELRQFYARRNVPALLGDEVFRRRVLRRAKSTALEDEVTEHERKPLRPSVQSIETAISEAFAVTTASLYQSGRGRLSRNVPRWVLMYLCQEAGGLTLGAIAQMLGFRRYATVSTTVAKLKREMESDPELRQRVRSLRSALAL